MIKKLIGHTAIYGIAPQIVSFVGLLILPLTTPYLTSFDFGIYGLITAIVGGLTVFQNLGLTIILSNSFYNSPNQYRWLWRQIYGFLILWNIVYGIILGAIIWFFLPETAEENKLYIVLLNVIPVIIFGSSTIIGQLYYQLKQKPIEVATRSVIIGIITVLSNLITIKYLKLGYMGWFYSLAISTLLYQTSYFIPLNFKLGMTPIFNFKRKTIIKSLKIALPIIPHSYSNYFLNSFDRVIMGIVGVSVSDIGIYNAAKTPGNLMASGVGAANNAVGPLLLECYKKDDRVSEKKLNYTIILFVLFITSTLSLFSKEILPFIIRSPGLENIYEYSIIIIMAYNYRPIYVAANQRLFYKEKTKTLLKVSFISALISVISNFILIYLIGIYGAIISMFLSFMYMGYSGFYIKEFKTTKGTPHNPLQWLFITVTLTLLVYYCRDIEIKYKLIFLLVLSCAFLIKLYKTHRK